MIVLLGDDAETDTITGDPGRNEDGFAQARRLSQPTDLGAGQYGHRRSRCSSSPAPTRTIGQSNSRPRWAMSTGVFNRRVKGMQYWIAEPPADTGRQGSACRAGAVPIGDDVTVEWYLWSGQPQRWQYTGAQKAFIAIRHRDELYDITSDLSSYRTFRIAEKDVRDRLWLIIDAPDHDPARGIGVFPTRDRNHLVWGSWPQAAVQRMGRGLFRGAAQRDPPGAAGGAPQRRPFDRGSRHGRSGCCRNSLRAGRSSGYRRSIRKGRMR